MTKIELVRQHLLINGEITSWQAIEMYGATRLSAIIFELRKKGYDIRTIMCEFSDRYGNIGKYANYVLKGDK